MAVQVLTVEGPAVLEPFELAEAAAIARRYLGAEADDAWIAANADGDNVAIRMTPEHCTPPTSARPAASYTESPESSLPSPRLSSPWRGKPTLPWRWSDARECLASRADSTPERASELAQPS